HFGVALAGRFSSTLIMRNIKKIVTNNPNIKVWNLSLGSNTEIHRNFISIEAETLDRIQYENDVIFVIAGTNDPDLTMKKIGSPADSINSIVVNSIDFRGNYTDYSRTGPVLDYFTKPDISYYGGTNIEPLKAVDSSGIVNVYGTSYSAPWIARK